MSEYSKEEWDSWRMLPLTKAFVEEIKKCIVADTGSVRACVSSLNLNEAAIREGIIQGYECMLEAIKELPVEEKKEESKANNDSMIAGYA